MVQHQRQKPNPSSSTLPPFLLKETIDSVSGLRIYEYQDNASDGSASVEGAPHMPVHPAVQGSPIEDATSAAGSLANSASGDGSSQHESEQYPGDDRTSDDVSSRTLEQEHIRRLSSIGFDRTLAEAKVPWETRFNELVQYKAKHGDCKVPSKRGKLGMWANSQRQQCKNKKLSQDRIDRLNSIGFKRSLKKAVPTVPWETRFGELVRYKAEHGDCNVPQKQGKLGTWVRNQRQAYTTGSLAQDRIDRLSKIGFKWD